MVEQRSKLGMLINITVYEDTLKFRFTVNTFKDTVDDFNKLVKGTKYEMNITDEELG